MTIPSYRLVAALVIFSFLPISLANGQAGDESQPKKSDPIRLRYAQLNLELAETQLERRLEQNEKMPNVQPVSPYEIRRYEMNVEVAKKQLAAAKHGADAVEVHLQRAKEQMQVAKEEYQNFLKAREAKAADPILYNKHELNELRLKAELAKLRFAIWSEPESNMLSIFDQVHWQLERLSEEVLELQRRFETLELK